MKGIFFATASALLAAANAAAQPIQAVQGADAAVWEGAADSGPIVHRASKVALPAELRGFKRYKVASLNSADVVANYRLNDGKTETLLTVYLFKPGALPEHKLKGSLASFAQLSPQAFVWAAGPFSVAASTPLSAYKATLKTGIGPDTVMDYLYFVELGDWTVKVRASVKGIDKVADEIAIDEFVRELPWAQVLAANGACRGAACTTRPVEEIDHHIMQTTLGRMLAMGMKFDRKKEAQLPVAAKAEIPLMGEAEIRRSDAKDLLYVTEVKNLATYRMVRIPEPANQLLTDAFGRLSVEKPLYGLMISIGGETLMPRLYHGEPTAEAFGKAVGDLVLNEMPPPMVPVSKLAERLPD